MSGEVFDTCVWNSSLYEIDAFMDISLENTSYSYPKPCRQNAIIVITIIIIIIIIIMIIIIIIIIIIFITLIYALRFSFVSYLWVITYKWFVVIVN